MQRNERLCPDLVVTGTQECDFVATYSVLFSSLFPLGRWDYQEIAESIEEWVEIEIGTTIGLYIHVVSSLSFVYVNCYLLILIYL
jgi:hypothetical protein